MGYGCDSHFETDEEILQACRLFARGKALNVVQHADANGETERDALPKRKEHHRLDAEELFKGAIRQQQFVRRMVEENQSVQGARDGHVVDDGNAYENDVAYGSTVMFDDVQLDDRAGGLDKDELQHACAHGIDKGWTQPERLKPHVHWPRVFHPRLVFKIATEVEISAAILDEKNDKIVNDVRLVRVANELEDEGVRFIGDDECKPGGERVDGHHGEDAHDVQLVLRPGVVAQVESDVADG